MRHRPLLAFFQLLRDSSNKTINFAGHLALNREGVLFLDVAPRGPFTRSIEQIRQEQGLPDLVLAVSPRSKFSATFKFRLFSFREIP